MTHLDDGALLRVLDGEAADPADDDHLRSCAACCARLEALRARSARVRHRLASVPPPVHPGYGRDFVAVMARAGVDVAGPGVVGARRVPRWAWGLMAAAVAGVIFVATPAAAWLVAGIGELIVGAEVAEEVDAERVAPADAGQGGTTAVSTGLEGDRLVVRLLEGEAPSRVVVRVTDGALATARILPAGSRGGLTVRPDGFEVSASADQTVEVDVPPGVASVEIWIGDRRLASRTASALGVEPWVVDTAG